MTLYWLILTLCGCQTPSTPEKGDVAETMPAVPMSTGPSTNLLLDLIPGEFDLPDHNLPPELSEEESFTIDTRKIGPNRFLVDLPFKLPPSAQRFKPIGLSVFVGDAELTYKGNLRGKGRFWTVTDKGLTVVGSDIEEVRLTYPPFIKSIARLSFGRANMSPAEFVKSELSFNDETRRGLFLPAPGVAEWVVTLPEKARFESFVAMKPSPVAKGTGDGATMSLSVTEGGDTTEIGQIRVTPQTGGFTPWNLDLSAFSGETVTLRLTSQPGKTNHWDYPFIGSPIVSGTPTTTPRHVVVIGLDTTRPDHFSQHGYPKETTAPLDELSKAFFMADKAWTPAPRTRPSFRSATTGRLPLQAVGATNIGTVFHNNGFATAGVVANVHLNPRFDFNEGYGVWLLRTTAKADDQVDYALDWFQQNKDKDAFMFLHFMDPHLVYRAPANNEAKFLTNPDPTLTESYNRSDVYRWIRDGSMTDIRKEHIVAMYDAEINFTAEQIQRFLTGLDALDSSTVVVIHSDHGEEFFEHGAFEHNHTLYQEVTSGLLWLRIPDGRGGHFSDPVALTDIAPTLYDYYDFDSPPTTDGISLMPVLRGETLGAVRDIPIGHLRFGAQAWSVVVDGRFKYTLYTRTGREDLYDLETDPDEKDNIAAQAKTLAPYRDALARSHKIDVGPGWRINLRLKEKEPVTLSLPQPALSAGILEPNQISQHPVNEAWGETPRHRSSDVGVVTLSDDKRSVTIEPGSHGFGVAYIRFSTEVGVDGQAQLGRAKPSPFELTRQQKFQWKQGRSTLTISAGPVLVTPPSEAARMSMLRDIDTENAASEDELSLLKSLGYIE